LGYSRKKIQEDKDVVNNQEDVLEKNVQSKIENVNGELFQLN